MAKKACTEPPPGAPTARGYVSMLVGLWYGVWLCAAATARGKPVWRCLWKCQGQSLRVALPCPRPCPCSLQSPLLNIVTHCSLWWRRACACPMVGHAALRWPPQCSPFCSSQVSESPCTNAVVRCRVLLRSGAGQRRPQRRAVSCRACLLRSLCCALQPRPSHGAVPPTSLLWSYVASRLATSCNLAGRNRTDMLGAQNERTARGFAPFSDLNLALEIGLRDAHCGMCQVCTFFAILVPPFSVTVCVKLFGRQSSILSFRQTLDYSSGLRLHRHLAVPLSRGRDTSPTPCGGPCQPQMDARVCVPRPTYPLPRCGALPEKEGTCTVGWPERQRGQRVCCGARSHFCAWHGGPPHGAGQREETMREECWGVPGVLPSAGTALWEQRAACAARRTGGSWPIS